MARMEEQQAGCSTSLLYHSFLALFSGCAYAQGSAGGMAEGEEERVPQSPNLAEVMCVLMQTVARDSAQ